MVVLLVCACLINAFTPILIVLAVGVGLLFVIKGYYIVKRFI